MPDTVIAADIGASSVKTTPATQGASTGVQTDKGLSEEAVKGMVHDAVQAALRRERETAAKPKATEQVERTLNQRMTEIEGREQKAAEKERLSAVREEALRLGVSPEKMKIFLPYVLNTVGGQIVNRDGDVGWQLDDNSPLRPLADLITDVLTKDGAMFRPPQSVAAGVRGLKSSSYRSPAEMPQSYSETDREKRLAMTTQQRIDLARGI
jgi:hypothetical protein